MRVQPLRKPNPEGLRSRALRLDKLPLRPLTARSVMSALPDHFSEHEPGTIDPVKSRGVTAVDPAWVLANASGGEPSSALALIAETCWWPVSLCAGPSADVMVRLWRHSVAVSGAARSLARSAGDPDPEAVARAGLLCRLGCWIVAAVDPEWLVRWWKEENWECRRRRELADLGTDLNDLARRVAEAWGCPPLVVDAAWMYGDHTGALNGAAFEPQRLALIQEAHRWAEQTPWSLESHRVLESLPSEPRLRILVAEVQARCGTAFVAPDATAHEERMTRQNARLRLSLAAARHAQASSERLLRGLADSPPGETPEAWAARAAMTWCAEPEVRAARVVWLEPDHADRSEPAAPLQPNETLPAPASSTPERRADLVFPLSIHGRKRAQVQLWCDPEHEGLERRLSSSAARAAWELWTTLLVDKALLQQRLQSVVASTRQIIATDEARLSQSKLDALGEFAAGAGHELNNPLAVVVGRAQLLLARSEDPETARSLRIILGQAARAHRILRDLMFVARPPAPRRRACRPAEMLTLCLRDVQGECESRGIKLSSEVELPGPPTWGDPESLRHLAEILLRNALQATPPGGKIEVRSSMRANELVWCFSDSGKGITASEAAHLFDPFYCGRQAGRGLGMGLPRAARIVEMEGGHLRWSSNPGHGAVFQVHLPLCAAPEEADRPA